MKTFIDSLCERWVKGPFAKITVERVVFNDIDTALEFGRKHADEGRCVSYSSDFSRARIQGPVHTIADGLFRGSFPPLGRRERLYIVTVRPTPLWQESDDVKAKRAKEKAKAKAAQQREYHRKQGA